MNVKLDNRLSAVAAQIRSGVHADIGSDHGYLLRSLLLSGRIDRGIAVENKQRPYQNSLKALSGLNADVRLADGLAGLEPGEADSLSLCGMGGALIETLLDAFPKRVPTELVVQPNRNPECVRNWAFQHHFHLIDERIVLHHHRYVVMRFRHTPDAIDPAYEGIDRQAASLFGPLLIKRWEPDFSAALSDEHRYLSGLVRLSGETANRLETLGRLLERHPPTDVD